jgi:pimeloyl-ACP methyl ester carboxylesterase
MSQSPIPDAATRRSRLHWPRLVFWLASSAVLIATAGTFYQSFSVARDRRVHGMPGQLVVVENRKMHIDCSGQGTPPVILDSGLGDISTSWREVQPQIARFTRVCSYDRAGLGYSDPSDRSRTSKDIAEELHMLLHNAGVTTPVVLVGHSSGGLNVRMFASLYPNEIAGMVLVDSSHPEQDSRLPPALKAMDARFLRQVELEEIAMRFGVPRLCSACDRFDYCHNDGVDRAAECNLHTLQEAISEWRAFPESAAQVAAAGSLRDMPLIVLSHDPDKPDSDLPPDLDKAVRDAFDKMQDELVQLSSKGSRTIAKNSGHYIQLERPEVVIEAVGRVVTQVREAAVTQLR